VEAHARKFPRVARGSQPWAGGRNPLGILFCSPPRNIRVRCSGDGRTPAVALRCALLPLTALILGSVAGAATISGPDAAVVVTVQASSSNLNYSITYRGLTVIETSPLG